MHSAINMCHHWHPSVQMLSESFFICIIQTNSQKHVFTLSLIQSTNKVGSVTFYAAILLKQEQKQANKHMLSLLHAMKGLLVCLNSQFLLATNTSCTHRFH